MKTGLIMEIRGCMTRFDPLTPEIVKTASCGGLIYDELAEQMQKAGFSIEKAVYDRTRRLQNAFYADYENGLYCEVYLQRSYLDTLLKIATLTFQGERSSFLADKDWRSFYICSPRKLLHGCNAPCSISITSVRWL